METHTLRPIRFSLVVDNCGVKYTNKKYVDHLLNALKQHYEMSEDWEGKLYCGITLKWYYNKRLLYISMPGYVSIQLTKYKHNRPTKPVDTPLIPKPRTYGKESQKTNPPDTTSLTTESEKKIIQQVVGSFLYYARAVDMAILHALSDITSTQSSPTKTTLRKVRHFLDYMHSHQNAIILYRASDMILNIQSYSSYLTASNARSRAGGHLFLRSIPRNDTKIKVNGSIRSLCTILKTVSESAAEAELSALFHNVQQAKIIQLTLQEMGHTQPPISIHIDNTTAVSIVNNTIKRQ